ncbi:transposase [Dapis sp. BLCC M229]
MSYRETVEKIKENSYLQYLICLESYNKQAPFDASILVDFRERCLCGFNQ